MDRRGLVTLWLLSPIPLLVIDYATPRIGQAPLIMWVGSYFERLLYAGVALFLAYKCVRPIGVHTEEDRLVYAFTFGLATWALYWLIASAVVASYLVLTGRLTLDLFRILPILAGWSLYSLASAPIFGGVGLIIGWEAMEHGAQ